MIFAEPPVRAARIRGSARPGVSPALSAVSAQPHPVANHTHPAVSHNGSMIILGAIPPSGPGPWAAAIPADPAITRRLADDAGGLVSEG